MALSKESIRKLRAVKRAIRAEPELYNQYTFATHTNPCGSACCIAGWAIWKKDAALFQGLAENGGFAEDWSREGASALSLSIREVKNLFAQPIYWPSPFSYDYLRACSDKERAEVGAARIEHFIATGGAE